MITVDLSPAIKGTLYSALLAFAADLSSEFRFVTFDRWPLGDDARSAIDVLRPYYIRDEVVTAWPNTRLGGGWTARLWSFRSEATLAPVVKSFSDGLFDWGGPLPDDPHFVRADGSVLLGTTISELDAWLELTEEEVAALNAVPEFAGILP